jgi:hypothetical protein
VLHLNAFEAIPMHHLARQAGWSSSEIVPAIIAFLSNCVPPHCSQLSLCSASLRSPVTEPHSSLDIRALADWKDWRNFPDRPSYRL